MHSLWSEFIPIKIQRASDLLARVQDGFDDFISSLPLALNETARCSNTFDGLPGQLDGWRLEDLTPALTGIPWLFWEIFHPLPDNDFTILALAGTYLGLGSIVMDHLVDGQIQKLGHASELRLILANQGKQTLEKYISPSSSFWEHFNHMANIHQKGWEYEHAVRAASVPYTEDLFRSIGEGKAAPPMMTVAAFIEALGLQAMLPSLERSILASVMASLIGDDLHDWREDLAERRLTFFLSRLASDKRWAEGIWPDEAKLQSVIDSEWMDVKYWRKTKGYLETALAEVQDIPCTSWKAFIDRHRILADGRCRSSIARHILKKVEKIAPKEAGR
jgi:hypothetical protein